jgi:hypothetical protein
MRSTLITLLVYWPTSIALAHGGGLNAEGCHNNRKTGDYHCHRAPSVAAVRQQLAPQGQADQAAQQRKAATAPAAAAGPTCYVGPRGGTYTITKSGRKNYGGC